MKKLTISSTLSMSPGLEILVNLNHQPTFTPAKIRLETFETKKGLNQKTNVAGIGHLQALLENIGEIPSECLDYISLAPGSIFMKGNKLFIPALVHNASIDAVALSNRDPEWSIILVELNSPISPTERVMLLE